MSNGAASSVEHNCIRYAKERLRKTVALSTNSIQILTERDRNRGCRYFSQVSKVLLTMQAVDFAFDPR